jgi:transcriptional regulator with XRE-family HTH domain
MAASSIFLLPVDCWYQGCEAVDTLDRQVGQRVRELRTRAGLTQEKLGEEAELHFSYIGQIERGEKSPSLKSVVAIAEALGVSVACLLDPDARVPEETEALAQRFLAITKNSASEDVELCLDLIHRMLDHIKTVRGGGEATPRLR